MEPINVIVTSLLGLISVYAGIVGWLGKHAIASLESQLKSNHDLTAKTKDDLEQWKLDSTSAHTRSDVGIAKLETAMSERGNDIIEIKALLSMISTNFISKADLRNSMDELKELIAFKYNKL